mmetsp:Transcript_21555/g.42766  ORF Transcript_21555/g.42766 Transcript_21555/m.42766 type:complete len:1153 (-) Transcript_21555:595-4053(-)
MAEPVLGGFSPITFKQLMAESQGAASQSGADKKRKRKDDGSKKKPDKKSKSEKEEKKSRKKPDGRSTKSGSKLQIIPSGNYEAPPMALEDVKNETDFSTWLGWAKGVWTLLGKERALRTQGKVRRIQSGRSRQEKVHDKPTVSAVVQAPSQPFFRVVEDDQLPNWNQVQPPTPNRNFYGLPSQHIRPVLMLWDFLNVFYRMLQIQKFSLQALIGGLVDGNRTHVLDYIYSALLRGVRLPAPSKFGDKLSTRGVVINSLSWQEHLRSWLAELASIPETESVYSDDQTSNFRDLAEILATKNFYDFSLDTKILILEILLDHVFTAPMVREHIDRGNTVLENTRKNHYRVKLLESQQQKARMTVLPEVSHVISDMVAKVILHQSNEEEKKAFNVLMYQQGLQKIAQKKIRDSFDAKSAQQYTEMANVVAKYPMRTRPLGKDRYQNIYFRLANNPSFIFVVEVSTETRKAAWGYYNSQEDLDKFKKFLDPKGAKEKELLNTITNYDWDFNVQEQTGGGGFSYLKCFDTVPLESLADLRAAQEARLKEQKDSSGNSAGFSIVDHVRLRSSQVLLASQGPDEVYERCGLCQESVETKTEYHCEICHKTFEKEDISKEKFDEHVISCIRLHGFDDENLPAPSPASSAPPSPTPLASSSSEPALSLAESQRSSAEPDSSSLAATDLKAQDVDVEMKQDLPAAAAEAGARAASDLSVADNAKEEGEEAKPVSRGLTRSGQRSNALKFVSEEFKAVKSVVLDVEAAIPIEAVIRQGKQRREKWIENTKFATTLEELGSRMLEIAVENLRPDWIRPWLNIEEWQEQLLTAQTLSAFSAAIFKFDRALLFSEDEYKKAKSEKIEMEAEEEESSSSSEEEDDDTDDKESGCIKCGSTDDPEKILLCDGCNKEHHTYCVNLRSIPKGLWFCPSCKKAPTKKAPVRAAKKPAATAKKATQKPVAKGKAGCHFPPFNTRKNFRRPFRLTSKITGVQSDDDDDSSSDEPLTKKSKAVAKKEASSDDSESSSSEDEGEEEEGDAADDDEEASSSSDDDDDDDECSAVLVLSPGAVREEIARANALFGAAAVAVAAEEISEEISGVAAGKSSNSGSSSLSPGFPSISCTLPSLSPSSLLGSPSLKLLDSFSETKLGVLGTALRPVTLSEKE